MSVRDGDAGTVGEVHDRAINHIFGSGLVLTGIVNRQPVEDEITRQLRDVIEELDAAVRELWSIALTRIIAHRDASPATPQRSTTPLSMPDPVADIAALECARRLRHVADDRVFAYALRGHDFYRARDHQLWAHDSDGLLLSARSGTPFARRVGNVFYDLESDAPLYYEDERAGLGPLPVQASGMAPVASPSFDRAAPTTREVVA